MNFLVSATCFIFIEIWIVKAECELGWFGKQCNFQCHCTNNSCYTDGVCFSGVSCDFEWFGPLCQYQNLASVYTANIAPHKSFKLVGEDECNIATGSPFIEVTWNVSYTFTFLWMRFNASLDSPLCLSVNISNGTDFFFPHWMWLNETVLEVRYKGSIQMTSIHLSGESLQYLCSLYVSGGRNVALKQNATQDSEYWQKSVSSVASNAVDGNRSSQWPTGRCMHSAQFFSTHYWRVHFNSAEIYINRYVLYSRLDVIDDYSSCCLSEIQRFTIESRNDSDIVVFSYTDPGELRLIHTVTSPSMQVSVVTLTRTEYYLSFCEAEMYGDYLCPFGYYGIECTKACNCANKSETCHVDTGTCPTWFEAEYDWNNCTSVPIEVKTFTVNGSKSIKANYSDSVVLHCEVTGSGGTYAVLSGPELSKFKNVSDNTAVIDKTFANLTCQDAGRYFCWGQNGGGENGSREFVDVNITCLVEPPPVYQGKPYKPEKQITIESEKNTTFQFVVYGYPEPTSYDLRIQTIDNSYSNVTSNKYNVQYIHQEPPFGLVTLTIYDENTKETITYVLGINSEKGRVEVTVEVVKFTKKPAPDDTKTQMAIGIGVGVGGFLIVVVIVVVCTVKYRRSRTPAGSRGMPMDQLYDKPSTVYSDRHYALAYENKIASDYDLPKN